METYKKKLYLYSNNYSFVVLKLTILNTNITTIKKYIRKKRYSKVINILKESIEIITIMK